MILQCLLIETPNKGKSKSLAVMDWVSWLKCQKNVAVGIEQGELISIMDRDVGLVWMHLSGEDDMVSSMFTGFMKDWKPWSWWMHCFMVNELTANKSGEIGCERPWSVQGEGFILCSFEGSSRNGLCLFKHWQWGAGGKMQGEEEIDETGGEFKAWVRSSSNGLLTSFEECWCNP